MESLIQMQLMLLLLGRWDIQGKWKVLVLDNHMHLLLCYLCSGLMSQYLYNVYVYIYTVMEYTKLRILNLRMTS